MATYPTRGSWMLLVLATGCMPTFALAKEVKLADVINLPEQIKIDALLGTPTLLAGSAQKAFLKVDLAGTKTEAKAARPPVNMAIVVDHSGSMAGDKLEEAKKAAILAVSSLAPTDIVSVVIYDHTVDVIVPATSAANKDAIAAAISAVREGGSTALFAGVSKAAFEVRKSLSPKWVNRIVLLSDGMANVGPSSPAELSSLGASLGKEGIAVTTIGLGLGYNEDLMMQLALASDGNHAFVENAAELAKIFGFELDGVMSVVAQNVDVRVELAPGVKPVRVLGREAAIDGQTIRTRLNQLYAGNEKYLLIEVEVPALRPGEQREVADVAVSFANMATNTQENVRSKVKVAGTSSAAEVRAASVAEVMVAAAEMIATEQNKLALALRDEGKIEKAREVLKQNAEFLREQNQKTPAPVLKRLEKVNVDFSDDMVDESKWQKNRKQMRDVQYEMQNQQTY